MTFVKTELTYRAGSMTLSGHFYTSHNVFDIEQHHIFAHQWLYAGRAADLQAPGAYRQVVTGRDKVLVVRGSDEAVRAFHNVCRHRGTLLCREERGQLPSTIQCPYHAWTYGLDGNLLKAPHMEDVPGFDKQDYPLRPVALERWAGFLFVNLAIEPDPLSAWLAPVIRRFSHRSLEALHSFRRIEYDVAANWKLIFLNFSECLHCPMIHPKLVKLTPYLSGENDLSEGPVLGGFMLLRDEVASMTMSGKMCGALVGALSEADQRRVYYYSIFPNMLLSVHPDYVMVHTLKPQAPDRTSVSCEWLFHPDSKQLPAFNPDDAVEFWDMTNRQDWDICQRSQAGIASSGYVPGPFAPRESLLAAWDREYLRRLGGHLESSRSLP